MKVSLIDFFIPDSKSFRCATCYQIKAINQWSNTGYATDSNGVVIHLCMECRSCKEERDGRNQDRTQLQTSSASGPE